MAAVFDDNTSSDIHFYTNHGPDHLKVAITLEELGLFYRAHNLESDPTHEDPYFPHIAPHGRLPGITDVTASGHNVRLFESGSIMQYLTLRYDTMHHLSYPQNSPEAFEVSNWLFYAKTHLGPAQKEAEHFTNEVEDSKDKVSYATERFRNETMRLYLVLEAHLRKAKSAYLVGEKCTIADVAVFPWVARADEAGVDVEQFPELTAWLERMERRPAVKRVLEREGQ